MGRTGRVVMAIVVATVVGGQIYRQELNEQRERKLLASWPSLQNDVLGTAATMKALYPAEAAKAENVCQGSYTRGRLTACEAQQDELARLAWDFLETKEQREFLSVLGGQVESDCSGTYSPRKFGVCTKEIEQAETPK
jgi:hypothetical protein